MFEQVAHATLVSPLFPLRRAGEGDGRCELVPPLEPRWNNFQLTANTLNHSSRIWSFAYPIVCKDRQYILGNWLIGNKIAGENVNFCIGVEGTYRFEKDEEPFVQGVLFNRGKS
ncbi:hypothetical protein ROZALSC1DRAFT_20034 [Rozella allomycis CSF55]|uniref:Uncharacterized protein n=1 Tax=Rozella allomycis (strain CSF55) TaxID=988480 RepID=A0A4P9YQQ9_ROZAC|nr:hypothetical protein ROZALSC1DRAFT_20034 [Rozella allomycis CSF55]